MTERGLLVTVITGVLMFGATAYGGELPTASFRAEHAEVKEHLQHLDAMAGALAAKPVEEQKKSAAFIVKFLSEHILEHAAWEEKHLYPAVDKRTHEGAHPFTGTMRYEHTIVGRWIGDLKNAAAKEPFDAVRFARDTDRLLGLIGAHFEEEEEVLLPVLDKTMTREQVEKELGVARAHQ